MSLDDPCGLVCAPGSQPATIAGFLDKDGIPERFGASSIDLSRRITKYHSLRSTVVSNLMREDAEGSSSDPVARAPCTDGLCCLLLVRHCSDLNSYTQSAFWHKWNATSGCEPRLWMLTMLGCSLESWELLRWVARTRGERHHIAPQVNDQLWNLVAGTEPYYRRRRRQVSSPRVADIRQDASPA